MKFRILEVPWYENGRQFELQIDAGNGLSAYEWFPTEQEARTYARLYAAGARVVADFELPEGPGERG